MTTYNYVKPIWSNGAAAVHDAPQWVLASIERILEKDSRQGRHAHAKRGELVALDKDLELRLTVAWIRCTVSIRGAPGGSGYRMARYLHVFAMDDLDGVELTLDRAQELLQEVYGESILEGIEQQQQQLAVLEHSRESTAARRLFVGSERDRPEPIVRVEDRAVASEVADGAPRSSEPPELPESFEPPEPAESGEPLEAGAEEVAAPSNLASRSGLFESGPGAVDLAPNEGSEVAQDADVALSAPASPAPLPVSTLLTFKSPNPVMSPPEDVAGRLVRASHASGAAIAVQRGEAANRAAAPSPVAAAGAAFQALLAEDAAALNAITQLPRNPVESPAAAGASRSLGAAILNPPAVSSPATSIATPAAVASSLAAEAPATDEAPEEREEDRSPSSRTHAEGVAAGGVARGPDDRSEILARAG